jgi:hypothetical protein
MGLLIGTQEWILILLAVVVAWFLWNNRQRPRAS